MPARVPLSRRRSGAAGLLLAIAVALPALAASSLLDRLDERSLAAVRRAAREIRQSARPAGPGDGLLDVRCALHVHSRLSHDSRGTPEEIAAAAREARVRAVFMTEHPTATRAWWTEGMRGEREGVLFVPGAELSDGLLVWRSDGTEWTPEMKAGPVLERLQGTPAVSFVAHPEERSQDADWELPPFTGMEIYNTHADAKDNGYENLMNSLRTGNPLQALSLLGTMKKYPREAFAALFDEQVQVLKRWDALNLRFLSGTRRVVGIAGNDSHQNVGIRIEVGESNLVVRNGLGSVVGEIPRKSVPLLLFGSPTPGSTLLAHTFDPYAISLGYVSTHLLASEVTEEALFTALKQGRAYIAFDWLADPTGFRYFAELEGQTVEMGGDVLVSGRPRLTARANLPCTLRLLRNGEEVQRAEGPELIHEAREPGVYRVEAWVRLGAESRPWIYGNPIYVR